MHYLIFVPLASARPILEGQTEGMISAIRVARRFGFEIEAIHNWGFCRTECGNDIQFDAPTRAALDRILEEEDLGLSQFPPELILMFSDMSRRVRVACQSYLTAEAGK